VKIRQDKRVINKSIFLALCINTEGQKELSFGLVCCPTCYIVVWKIYL